MLGEMASRWIFFAVALVAFPLTHAQDASAAAALASLPKCAIDCLGKIIPESPCSASNTTCMCTNQKLQSDMTICVTKSCSIKEAITTKNATATSCGAPVRDKSHEYITISNVFGVISAAFVIQRFGYKIWAKLDFGTDDWLTLLTIVSGVPNTVINAVGVGEHGMGRDAWTLSYDDITSFGKYFFILEIIYFFEVACLKTTLLFFYMRIFPAAPVRRLLWGTVVFTVLFGLTFILVSVFQCKPIDFYWKKWDGEHEGSCLNINILAWSNAAISIALDGWMLAIPLWQLNNLNLNWRRKVGVGMMFCVGTFVTIVSILRLKSLVKFGSDSMNPTWDFYDVGIWSTVEINVGIICTCMPSLRLLLVRLFPGLMGTTQKYYAKYSSNNARSSARRSRAVNASHISQVERGPQPPQKDMNGIRCQKSFTVEYGDNDEMELVHVRDLDSKSARSGVSDIS